MLHTGPLVPGVWFPDTPHPQWGWGVYFVKALIYYIDHKTRASCLSPLPVKILRVGVCSGHPQELPSSPLLSLRFLLQIYTYLGATICIWFGLLDQIWATPGPIWPFWQ